MRLNRSMCSLTPVIALALLTGCAGKAVTFPAQSNAQAAEAAAAAAAYDANLDGRVEYFLFANADGRVDRIGYDTTGDGRPDQIVPLDAIPLERCRHLVLILDGFGYEVVKDFYESGHLRSFYPPSRVIAPYPSMTDQAIQDLLGGMPCRAIEAKYYDRARNRLVGGANDYLAGVNEPSNSMLQYRAGMLWDAIGYVYPWQVFGKEVNDVKRVFDRRETTETLAYFVSSAGMGTSQGADGQRKCLERIEQLANQVIWETHGLTKVTLMADHGHSYTPPQRADFDGYLKGKGWRMGATLKGPRDAVSVAFGVVTCASFATMSPSDLAADLAEMEGVELASFADGESVIVLGRDGQRAAIRRSSDGRYSYDSSAGDPLDLAPILAGLKADEKSCYDTDELLAATADHEYPAPLERLWRAHFGLVENVPDVIVSLADGYYAGKTSFAGSVKIVSTHGSLNRDNSTAFIMSTAGSLPPLMRSRDVSEAMTKTLGTPWPMRR